MEDDALLNYIHQFFLFYFLLMTNKLFKRCGDFFTQFFNTVLIF
jgi:hypothetical protein